MITDRMQYRFEARRRTDYNEIAGGYRPYSACDIVGLHRQRMPCRDISHQGLPLNQCMRKLLKPKQPTNRYDYLSNKDNHMMKAGNYPDHHSLNYLNRKNLPSKSPALYVREPRSKPTIHQYDRLYKRINPSNRNCSNKNIPGDIKPQARNYMLDNLINERENLIRKNNSFERGRTDRLQLLLRQKNKRKPVEPKPKSKNQPSHKNQRRLNNQINSPLGLNLDIILTESIIQVPSQRHYR